MPGDRETHCARPANDEICASFADGDGRQGGQRVSFQPWQPALPVTQCGLFLAVVGILLGVPTFGRAAIEGPLLTIGPEGMRDAGVCDRLIPWPALSWRHVVYFRGAAIMYDIDEKITGPLELSLPIRILAAANRALGYGRFSLMTMGTGKSLEELATLLSAYKPESRG